MKLEPGQVIWLVAAKAVGRGWRVVRCDKTEPMIYWDADHDEPIDYRLVVAIHSDEDSAKRGLRRAKKTERLLREGWKAAIELATRLERQMADEVTIAAQPEIEAHDQADQPAG